MDKAVQCRHSRVYEAFGIDVWVWGLREGQHTWAKDTSIIIMSAGKIADDQFDWAVQQCGLIAKAAKSIHIDWSHSSTKITPRHCQWCCMTSERD